MHLKGQTFSSDETYLAIIAHVGRRTTVQEWTDLTERLDKTQAHAPPDDEGSRKLA